MRVSVLGAGYVGLVTAACLSELGHEVICAERDEDRVAQISAGMTPLYEPGLAELLARHAGRGLRATSDTRAAVLGSDLTLIAVGTPFADGRIDLTQVTAASRAIGAALAEKDTHHTVAVKSTVVPGTTDSIVTPALEKASGKRAGIDFGVGTNPEFLTEGQAVADFMSPDRIVLGGEDTLTLDVLEELHAGLELHIPRLRTTTRTAEMIKYASNALLATSISFANEIANLCSALGDVDAVDVMRGVHLSRYLTPLAPDGSPVQAPIASFLEAGCGFGGSCLPKDMRALAAHGEQLGRPMPLLRAVLEVNDARAGELLRILRARLGGLAGKRVTVLGLAFKPDTDDVRESPALPVIRGLLDEDAEVKVHDPVAHALPDDVEERVRLSADLVDSLAGADAVVLVTRWKHYEELPTLVAGLDPVPVIVDGRRMLDKTSFAQYAGIGL